MTFPTAFSTACYSVQVIALVSADVGGIDNATVLKSAPTTTGVDLSTPTGPDSFYWVAIGS